MNFAFSPEQEAFRETLQRFFAERSPPADAFRWIASPDGHDPALWKQMALELGLQGLHVPEAWGGQGFGFLELGIAVEEMGRGLVCSPFFSTVCLAANAILNAASDAHKRALLPDIARGERLATLALLEREDADWDAADVALPLRREGSEAILEGHKVLVTDGAAADLLLVAARAPGAAGPLALVALRADAAGVSREPVEALDPTRRLANLHFDGARGEVLAEGPAAEAALEKTVDQARVAIAAESVGAAQRCLDASVAYARQRVQFGRPIGSFQAIQHKCADVLLELENARSTAWYASWTAAEDAEELPLAASLAKACCGEAFLRAAAENVQIHGGIGFTWEAEPQLHYKRARFDLTLLGDARAQRARLARLQGF